jgi:glycosyltransferase involved in cell wall biosynthesis
LSYKYENKKSREITFGFLGDKNTTYSNHFLNSTLQELSKIEKTFDCNVNLNIIGKNWNYSDIFKNFNSTKFMKIKLLGFVSDLSLEMSKIDFMLYLENYSIGVRTRILSAMSFKCPVIVHESARSGIPELHDNVNAIILNDCGQLNKIIRKIQKGEINRNFIINNAFELWSQKYSEKEFTKNITSIIFK